MPNVLYFVLYGEFTARFCSHVDYELIPIGFQSNVSARIDPLVLPNGNRTKNVRLPTETRAS